MSNRPVTINNKIITDVMEEYSEVAATADKTITQDLLTDLSSSIKLQIEDAVSMGSEEED